MMRWWGSARVDIFFNSQIFLKSIFDWNWKNQGNEPGSEGSALKMVLIPYYYCIV